MEDRIEVHPWKILVDQEGDVVVSTRDDYRGCREYLRRDLLCGDCVYFPPNAAKIGTERERQHAKWAMQKNGIHKCLANEWANCLVKVSKETCACMMFSPTVEFAGKGLKTVHNRPALP